MLDVGYNCCDRWIYSWLQLLAFYFALLVGSWTVVDVVQLTA